MVKGNGDQLFGTPSASPCTQHAVLSESVFPSMEANPSTVSWVLSPAILRMYCSDYSLLPMLTISPHLLSLLLQIQTCSNLSHLQNKSPIGSSVPFYVLSLLGSFSSQTPGSSVIILNVFTSRVITPHGEAMRSHLFRIFT